MAAKRQDWDLFQCPFSTKINVVEGAGVSEPPADPFVKVIDCTELAWCAEFNSRAMCLSAPITAVTS